MKFKDDPHPGGPTEWADNPLSNTFARAALKLTPRWCRVKDHWTSRFAQALFTDCPCCLLLRGVVVGAGAASVLFGAVAAVAVLL